MASLVDLYSIGEVSRIFSIPASRLRSWDRRGFIRPSGKKGRLRFYTFQDLIGIRAAKGLLDSGLSVLRVRRSVQALRDSLPRSCARSPSSASRATASVSSSPARTARSIR